MVGSYRDSLLSHVQGDIVWNVTLIMFQNAKCFCRECVLHIIKSHTLINLGPVRPDTSTPDTIFQTFEKSQKSFQNHPTQDACPQCAWWVAAVTAMDLSDPSNRDFTDSKQDGLDNKAWLAHSPFKERSLSWSPLWNLLNDHLAVLFHSNLQSCSSVSWYQTQNQRHSTPSQSKIWTW